MASDDMREQSNYGCILDSKEQWLQRLTEVLNELAEDPESMMPGIRDSLYNEDVVVYTLKSEAITLPKGATALDFAYGVHTDIGDHAKFARINGRLASVKTKLKRGDCVEIGVSDNVNTKADWLDAVVSYKAKKHIRGALKRQTRPKYALCPHCHPMPEGEIIGFEDADGRITLHSRNCPEAIRKASENGSTIVAVNDFLPDEHILYPICLNITGIDRYHLLRDIIDCIVEEQHLSMTGLTTRTVDNIVSCSIDFMVHSAGELKATLDGIAAIEGVEEVKTLKKSI